MSSWFMLGWLLLVPAAIVAVLSVFAVVDLVIEAVFDWRYDREVRKKLEAERLTVRK